MKGYLARFPLPRAAVSVSGRGMVRTGVRAEVERQKGSGGPGRGMGAISAILFTRGTSDEFHNDGVPPSA